MMRSLFFAGVLMLVMVGGAPARAEEAPTPQYVYRAEITRVVTGDSVELNLDLGFGVWVHGQTLKLQDVDAPDLQGTQQEEALKWKARLAELLKDRAEIIVQTVKDKKAKPARYLVTIWADGVNINAEMKKPQ